MSQNPSKEAAELYLSDKTMSECCRILHIGQVKMMEYLKEENVKARPAHRREVSQNRRDDVVRLYKLGYSLKECQIAVKVGYKDAYRAIEEEELELRFAPWTDKKIQKLLTIYAEGNPIYKCAKALGTNGNTVRKYLRLNNIKIRPAIQYGEKNGSWKGGRMRGKDGYIYVRCIDHPRVNNAGYVFEHRLVMEEHLGRYLTSEEVVHHKNKKHDDNRIENLELYATNGEHLALELKGQCPKWSEEGKRILEACARRRKKSRSKNYDQRLRKSVPRKKK